MTNTEQITQLHAALGKALANIEAHPENREKEEQAAHFAVVMYLMSVKPKATEDEEYKGMPWWNGKM